MLLLQIVEWMTIGLVLFSFALAYDEWRQGYRIKNYLEKLKPRYPKMP